LELSKRVIPVRFGFVAFQSIHAGTITFVTGNNSRSINKKR
jgi:hypothetical protein